MRTRGSLTLGIFATALLVGCGGSGGASGDADLPTTPVPTPVPIASTVAAVSGNSQTGRAESALSAQLVVRVTTSQGTGVAGSTVAFATTSGSVTPATATTDASGNAQATWTLGAIVGPQTATAAVGALSGSPVSFSATATTAWTVDKTIFTNADFGGKAGVLADVTVLKLNDGRFRMFLGGVPDRNEGVRSAISTDGLTFTLESGSRLSCPLSTTRAACLTHPFVMRLTDGRVRLFAVHGSVSGFEGGIYSFTSTDEGVTFTADPGVRLSSVTNAINNMSGPSIVKTSTGWRMYVSDLASPTGSFLDAFLQAKVFSAISTDLVAWTLEPGIRIGAGAPTLTGSASHPGAIVNADGSVTLGFLRVAPNFTVMPHMFANSPDGVNFTREAASGLPVLPGRGIEGADAFLMHLPNGDVRMYYNVGDNNSGNILVAHRAPFKLWPQ